MRTTYRVDIRRPSTEGVPVAQWQPMTRLRTRKDAETVCEGYAARGFETRITVER